QYRMCEWGIMKRAVEASCQGLRHRKIVALGASMSMFAIVVARDSNCYEPEMLKDKEIAVTPNNGSEFTTLKMMEGFLEPQPVKPEAFQTWRLLHAPPQPYTRERFNDTYNWTVKWNMTVPGATYENTVDNRAWE